MEHVEHILWNGQPLAYIIRTELEPEKTTFLTDDSFKHRPLERHLIGTSEVLIVKKGRCEIDVYNDARELVATRELRRGDVMLMIAGGHGFRMIEDTILLEVKQGPYTGVDEKERF
jgi:hypothetical protein